MAIENVVMTLQRIPEIKAVIDSGTDWKILGGFLLTALAVALGSLVTVITFKRTVRSQEKIARSIAIKESRQAWINELRDACAEYVASILLLQGHASSHSAHMDLHAFISAKDIGAAADMTMAWDSSRRSLRSSVFVLKTKIQLLANPSEEQFKRLMEEVINVIQIVEVADADVMPSCDKIISIAQEILKSEWDKTKAMR